MKTRNQTQTFIALAFGLVSYLIVFGHCSHTKPSIHDLIQIHTDEIYDSLVIIRRDIHQNPELAFNEVRTSKLVADYLLSLGLEVKTNIGGYGVVGILHGKTKGKIIGWRAEMDAYFTEMPDVVEFRSKVDSVRHICGHDVHTTIGLGIANVLTRLKDSINGTLVFIFQPAEEQFAGAKSMIDDGLYDIIKPDEIYCLHMSELPSGKVTLKSNAVFAYLKNISVTYKNQGNKESVESYTDSLLNRYSTLSNDDWDKIYDKEVGVFNESSDFKDFILYCGGYGCFEENKEINIKTCFFGSDRRKLDSLPEKLADAINQSLFFNQLVSVTSTEYPTNIVFGLNNDPELTEKVRNTISRIYGQNSILPMYGVVVGFGDDFAYFQQDIPGGYYLLGGSNYEKGIICAPHTPNFAVDEKCIAFGVKYFSSMIVERLKDEE
jgi:metal-dependent amidase/aminoacylase/carboxypeptidase family protein